MTKSKTKKPEKKETVYWYTFKWPTKANGETTRSPDRAEVEKEKTDFERQGCTGFELVQAERKKKHQIFATSISLVPETPPRLCTECQKVMFRQTGGSWMCPNGHYGL